jgi:hypothetical protein
MKTELSKIAQDLEQNIITENEARSLLLGLLGVVPPSYGIVRWHENDKEDVVCVNKAVARDYVAKYNKLAGEEKCYLDEEVWLPLNKA